MVRRVARTAFAVGLAVAATAVLAAEQDGYQPRGQTSWDYWFARSGGLYHAFYLQAPVGTREKWGASTVGLATSRDLRSWTEVGEILRASPPGEWNDRCIATGSVWKQRGAWLMVFTASGKGPAIGLARSPDLRRWEKVGPIRIVNRPFVTPDAPYWRSRGFAAGRRLTATVLADCYVLPDPVDGWRIMAANAVIDGEPAEKRGCTLLLRSRDGLEWEDWTIAAAPREYDRLETPQVWKHGHRWYLYFGAARENPGFRANCLYTAAAITGPFEPAPGGCPPLPNGQSYYIAKVVPGPDGRDYFLGCVGAERLSAPWLVRYGADGSVTLVPTGAAASP